MKRGEPRFRRWSKEDVDTLIRMRQEGASISNIAARLGRTPRQVRSEYFSIKNKLISEKDNI